MDEDAVVSDEEEDDGVLYSNDTPQDKEARLVGIRARKAAKKKAAASSGVKVAKNSTKVKVEPKGSE